MACSCFTKKIRCEPILVLILYSPRPRGNNYFVNFALRTLNIFWSGKIILWPAQKSFPRTAQGSLKPNERRKQDVHFTGFNFLDCAGMQSHHFGKPFLGDSLKHPFTADIIAERSQLRCWKRSSGTPY